MKRNSVQRHDRTIWQSFGLALLLVLGLAACEPVRVHPTLCPELRQAPVRVVFHWPEGVDEKELPNMMRVALYPEAGSPPQVYDLSSRGGLLYAVLGGRFRCLSYEYDASASLLVENEALWESFFLGFPTTARGGEQEPLMEEPDCVHLYADSKKDTLLDLRTAAGTDTLELHFWPRNTLRQFTILIYGLTGQGIGLPTGTQGLLSGMSSTVYPATGLYKKSCAIRFSRSMKLIPDGQKQTSWTDIEKALFAAKNPKWDKPETEGGWGGHWLICTLYDFGPATLTYNYLMLQAASQMAVWGQHDEIGEQLRGAMGERQTWEEQQAWRAINAGYDIVLGINQSEDGYFEIPKDTTKIDGGGFETGTGEWDDVPVPLYPKD